MGKAQTKLYDSVATSGISTRCRNELPELWEIYAGDEEFIKGDKARQFLNAVFLCFSQEGKRENRVADNLLSTQAEIDAWLEVLDPDNIGFSFGQVIVHCRVLRDRKSSLFGMTQADANPRNSDYTTLFETESDNRLKFQSDLLAICGVVPVAPFKVIHHTYDEIPKHIKALIADIGFKRAECELHVDAVWNIIHFLLPDHLPSKDFRIKQKVGPNTPTVSDSDIKAAELLLQPLPPGLFKKTKYLDKGGFGSVFYAPIKIEGRKTKVAIKKVNHGKKDARYNLMEISFLSRLSHPNLVSFVCCFVTDPKKTKVEPEVWIIMEYLEGGTLAAAASKSITLSEHHISYIARETFRGLEFLHSKNLVHRDIKSANIMLDMNGGVKLIDFGLCADLSCGPQMCMVGSSYWIPPEMMSHDPHGLPADIWSAGVCFLELFNHGPPFYNHSHGGFKCMLTACMRGLSSQIPANCSPGARDFFSKCLIREQYDRATATQLLRLPWLSQPDLGKGIEQVLVQLFLGSVSFS